MLININIRVKFTVSETGETFTIDSKDARDNGNIIPFIAFSQRSVAGIAPVANLTIANLPPEILTKVSLLNLKSTVRVDAGYNDNYHFVAEGPIVRFPEIQSTDTDWLWTCDITSLPDFLNDIDYTENFNANDTWSYVMNRFFGNTGLTLNIPENLGNRRIGVDWGYNINTFVALQDHFKARDYILYYNQGIITFTDSINRKLASVEITPDQIRPNQYLDFQSQRSAGLSLAAWVPNITSGLIVDLKDESSVFAFNTTKGFNGTMWIESSSIYLSTSDDPTHELTLRTLTQTT